MINQSMYTYGAIILCGLQLVSTPLLLCLLIHLDNDTLLPQQIFGTEPRHLAQETRGQRGIGVASSVRDTSVIIENEPIGCFLYFMGRLLAIKKKKTRKH